MKSEMEERIKGIEEQNKNNNESIMKELESYKRNNKVLSEQIADLDKKLTDKND